MKIFFKKENLKTTIFTFIFIVFGVLFCTLLGKMFDFVESFLCFALLVAGFVLIAIYSFLPQDSKIYKLFIYGIFGACGGIFIIIWPKFFGIVLSIIIGYSGVDLIIQSIKSKKKCEKTWITDFVVGIVVAVLAVVTLILSGTNIAKNILSIFVGIILLIQGIYNIVELVIISKNEKIINQEKQENKTEIKEEENAE